MKLANLVGKTFGSVTVLSKVANETKNRYCLWETKCTCGNEKRFPTYTLPRQKTCGCDHARRLELVTNLKLCRTCGISKSLNMFSKSKDHLTHNCKFCERQRSRKKYWRDVEKSREKARRAAKRYATTHPDRVKNNHRRWREAHIGLDSERSRQRRLRLKAAGLCAECGKSKAEPPYVTCSTCHKKQKAAVLAHHANNPESRLERHVKKYGISLEEYKKLLISQNKTCAVCKSPSRYETDSRTKKPRRLAIDHCHITGKVRALLCGRCNTAVGLVDEKPEIADAIASYLRSHQASV